MVFVNDVRADRQRQALPRVVSAMDLLDRQPNPPCGPNVRASVAGKRVLVTGAGGSIGSEIVRQLTLLRPATVFCLDHDESALHSLQLQLAGHGLLDDERTVLADVRDRAGIHRILGELRPDLVYHAAAHKHLPLLERYPREGVKTNVLGTENVVSAAVEAGVTLFINVSTDKAARPQSVLGITKRIAEMIVTAHAGRGTRVASVRFGNVLGSRGSFLESLAFQLSSGDPVTVTDRDATRFFMTIAEAALLVIETSVMADRGETFVLDMGDPVRILDLVQRFVELSGAESPEFRFTGLRVGEKLHEQLFDTAETRVATAHPRIWGAEANPQLPERFRERVGELHGLTVQGHLDDLRRELSALLPNDLDAGAGDGHGSNPPCTPDAVRAASIRYGGWARTEPGVTDASTTHERRARAGSSRPTSGR